MGQGGSGRVASGVLSPWGLVSLGSLHVWGGHWQGSGHVLCLVSPFFPILGSLLVPSLDLSELAKAAKKKLQAVSLLPFLTAPRPSDRSPFL